MALHAVLLDLITLFQSVLVRPGDPITFAIVSVTIDALKRPIALAWLHGNGLRQRQQAQAAALAGRRIARFRDDLGAREVFRYLDLNIAQVPLTDGTLALLFVRVVRLGSARWSALHAAIPIVRDKGLALIALSRTMGVDIVHVWKVNLESVYVRLEQDSRW